MFNDFANWKIANPGKIPDQDDKDALKVYMKEKYAINPGEGSILDTIKGMNSPPIGDEDRKENTAAVVSTLASCSKKSRNDRRKKRSNEGGSKKHVRVKHKRCRRKYLKIYLLQFMQGK